MESEKLKNKLHNTYKILLKSSSCLNNINIMNDGIIRSK